MAKKADDLEDVGASRGNERRLSALDRAIMAALGDGRTVGRADDPAALAFPQLWEWLTKTDGGKDHIMQPAVITIQLGPEGCLATVTHRDLRVSCSAACPHLGDALAALQSQLSADIPPIRAWGKDEPHLKRRKQK